MTSMRRWNSGLALALACCLFVAACGDDDDTGDAPSTSTTPPEASPPTTVAATPTTTAAGMSITSTAFDDSELDVLLYEFKSDLDAYLAGLGPGAAVRSLADVIAFNDRNASREMPYFGQELMLRAQKKGPLTDPAYRTALATNRRLSAAEGIDATLKRHRLDAIVAPTQGPPALIDLVNGDPSGRSSTSPCAVAGYPAVTVAMGYVRGLPVGMTFMGLAWSEASLLKYAYAYEQATKVRRPPRYLATAELGP
jgi:amidase